MSHPLEQQIARVRRKVRLLVWVHGLCWLAAATLAAALALGLLDYLCHFSLPLRKIFADPGIRVICSLLVAGVFAWAGYRYVLRGARARFADVALASRVEGRFPDLHDRLTSAVEFLRESEEDPQAGSPELRRAVIAQTTAAVEQLQLSQTMNYRPAVRATLAVGGVVLLAATIVLLNPSAAQTALARLINPLGGPDWLQETHLRFQDEITRAATGKPLELVVQVDRGELLPRAVRLFVRFDGETDEHDFAMRPVDGKMVHRFASVTRPLTYWAEGGDDLTMRQRPIHLEVIEPPEVRTLAIELHPPTYTLWPAVKSEKHIRALEGTRVAFEGRASKPLQSATLCFAEAGRDGSKNNDGKEGGSNEGGKSDDGKAVQQLPAEVAPDGYGFRLAADAPQPFQVSRSGQYWFRLEDTEGIVGDDAPYEIRSVADLPPTVAIDEPRQDAEFTAAAVVPLRITAKDDLALRSVTLQVTKAVRGSDARPATREIAIWAAEKPPEQPHGLATDKLGDSRPFTHELALKDLFSDLAPGTQLTLVFSASDFRPQTGQSPALRLTIITPDQLVERVSERQRSILQKLYEVLVTERTARKELGGVEARFEQIKRLEKIDLDGLERTKLSQDRVNDALGNETNGVAVQIERLLAYLRDNRVDSTDIARRMGDLLAEVRRLQKGPLPAVVNELRDAGKAAQSKLETKAQQEKLVGESLTGAGKHQDEVIAALEAILSNMTEWDSFHRFSREIAGLRREHESIAGETAKLAPETLTKDFKDLTPQQQGELKKLARRQQDLAREFDAIGQRMESMKGQLADKDPLAAGVLEDALHHARSQRVSNALRQAAGNLEQNQLGQAGQTQQAVDNSLREMLDILANRREQNLSRLVKKLREAEQELKDLANRQKGLQKKMEAAAANPDEAQRRRELKKLAEEQRRLQQETDRLARKLQRLQAEQAGSHASSAAGQMGKAGEQSQKGDAAGAEKNAEQALKDLEQAGEELAEARRQAELDLALEQLAKISDALEGLKNRQQSLSSETLRLDQLAAKQQLTDGQKESVRNLSRQEGVARQDTLDLGEKLSAAAVFQAALKGAARELELAADQLQQLKTGVPTQTAQRNALRRFEQLLEALKLEPANDGKKKEKKEGGGGKGGGGKQQPMPKDGIPGIAQLKLLKMMQLELNERTKELDTRLAGRKPEEFTEVDRRERDLISQQQGEVARLTLNLSRPAQAGAEDGAEKLPDFSPDAPDKRLDSDPPGAKNQGDKKQGKKDKDTAESDSRPPAKEPRPPAAKEPSP